MARLDTLDALDEITELAEADELKNKLLFSVVVVRKLMMMQKITQYMVNACLFIPLAFVSFCYQHP